MGPCGDRYEYAIIGNKKCIRKEPQERELLRLTTNDTFTIIGRLIPANAGEG